MSDKQMKDFFIEDINHINLGIHLLNEQLKKEMNENEVSDSLKKKLALLNSSIELMSKKHIPEHLEGKKAAEKSQIRIANDKIRELENKLGKSISLSDIPKLLSALKTEITEKTEQLGLYCSPEVNFHEYGIDVKLKYIRLKQNDLKYAKNEKEIEELKLKNTKLKESFYENFDVSPTEKNEDIKIKMTVKNIEIIQNVLSNIHSHTFELKSVSNGRFNEGFDLIDDMKFYLSTSNFNFPKMYYGD